MHTYFDSRPFPRPRQASSAEGVGTRRVGGTGAVGAARLCGRRRVTRARAAGSDGTAAGRAYSLKGVLPGEGCVGKTWLVLRYCENGFNDKRITTLQASFLTKKLDIGGKRGSLATWDTAGQERFHASVRFTTEIQVELF
ncbi:Ras-related protein Rab-21 [Plecturocebus cupreus]